MRFSYLLILFVSHVSFAQADMTRGYELLENGKLEEAVDFFSVVLESYPQNKTANICLGRAVGLSGDPLKALQIFAEADKMYPNDFELGLNLAEAYLWNKSPHESLLVYKELLLKEVNNYTANLGTANCYYELGDFNQALFYINTAISLQPQNPSTYNSKKYILLALAADKTKSFEYRLAIDQLNLILDFKPLDGHALLNKGINFIKLENFNLAEFNFQTLIDNDLELVESNILMSHLSMLKHKDKSAILYAEKAVNAGNSENEAQLLRANIQHVNALGAAKKFNRANELINELLDQFGNEESLLLAKARIKVWDREPIAGLKIYNELEPTYDVYMSKAEAHIALFNTKEAIELLDTALQLNPYSDDALRLKSELLDKKKTSIEFGGNRSFDDGFNQAQEVYLMIMKPVGDKHHAHLHAGYREAKNQLANVNADQFQIFVGDRFQLNSHVTLNTSLGMISNEIQDQSRSLNMVAITDLKYQFVKNQSISISYNRESLKYSTDLIRSGLINNKMSSTYQFQKPKLPGFIAQYNRAFYNDGNSNNSVFASLYYELSSFPLIKIGFNATHLSYKQQRPTEYFSPDVYKMAEVFMHVGNIFNKKAKFTYSVQMAIGKQQIANNKIETAQRMNLELGYKFKSGVSLNVNYFTNSAATANLKAYSFQKFGIRLLKKL